MRRISGIDGITLARLSFLVLKYSRPDAPRDILRCLCCMEYFWKADGHTCSPANGAAKP